MRNTFKNRHNHGFVVYAAIALFLTAMHAWSVHTFDLVPLELASYKVASTGKAYTVITSASGSNLQVELDRRGMTASAFDGLEQPLMIKNSECVSYAVSREITDPSRHISLQLAI